MFRRICAPLSLLLALLLSLAACANTKGSSDASDTDSVADTASDTVEADADSGEEVADGDTSSDAADATDTGDPAPDPVSLRVATYNASLYRDSQGQLASDLKGGEDRRAKRVAEVLQRVRPDIVLVNEFDRDPDGQPAKIFAEQYLAVGQSGAEPIDYPHRYVPQTNTGEHSGVDLNQDGKVDEEPGSRVYGNDAYGYGEFPGQYGMVIYSRYPIARQAVRSFRKLKWKAMPDNLMPTDWYSDAAVDAMRLSSKNHVDVPVEVAGRRLHILASHPTPPSFDGPEDRNGRRNHDEVRFWSDYVAGGERASYIEDGSGANGGLDEGARFVLLGDLNNDPNDGNSRHGAIEALLGHDRVTDPTPTSPGGRKAGKTDGGANRSHEGKHARDTADFSDDRVGNLRVDYALPSSGLTVDESGVWWPAPGEDHADLADVSDHRPVWVDVTVSSR